MVESARRERRTPAEIAAHYTDAFMRDIRRLDVLEPTVVIVMVERLLELGCTYEIDDGIYFDVTTFPGYGRLSRADQVDREG